MISSRRNQPWVSDDENFEVYFLKKTTTGCLSFLVILVDMITSSMSSHVLDDKSTLHADTVFFT